MLFKKQYFSKSIVSQSQLQKTLLSKSTNKLIPMSQVLSFGRVSEPLRDDNTSI